MKGKNTVPGELAVDQSYYPAGTCIIDVLSVVPAGGKGTKCNMKSYKIKAELTSDLISIEPYRLDTDEATDYDYFYNIDKGQENCENLRETYLQRWEELNLLFYYLNFQINNVEGS